MDFDANCTQKEVTYVLTHSIKPTAEQQEEMEALLKKNKK